MSVQKFWVHAVSFLFFALFSCIGKAASYEDMLRLKNAYPDFIQAITENEILWRDGTVMPINDGINNKTTQEKLDNPSLLDQVLNIYYIPGIPDNPKQFCPKDDPGRIRYLPFFQKMYGATKSEVEGKLVTIYWMPNIFYQAYPLQVTTVNNVDLKLMAISHELEELVIKHPEYISFLEDPGGTFEWRVIANTNRLSLHSFGMTIDINAPLTQYWQWDLKDAGKPVTEDEPLGYRNTVPWEIVSIFERYGFIWGGKWYHYDTMHFEYRPELF